MKVVEVNQPGAVKGGRRILLAGALFVLIAAWAAMNLLSVGHGFSILVSDKLQGSEEAASGLARMFGALVLGLFLVEEAGWRMRWLAGGLLILGLGHLIFGYLEPLVQNDPPELNESLYEAFVTQTFAAALFLIGLFPVEPPRFLVRLAIAIPLTLVAGYLVVFEFVEGDDWMPALASVGRLDSPFEGLTTLYWLLAAIPLGLAVAALASAFWRNRRGLLRGWLLFAMVVLTGSLLHGYLWPSAYGNTVLTTADVLGLAFAMLVAVGSIAELRRVASEHAALVVSERERIRRLDELNALRADFSAMVAHELGGPISAVRRLTEMLSAGGSDAGVREYVTDTMQSEIKALDALVTDVQATAVIEHDDFEIEARPLPLASLVSDAEAYANTLPGDHPVHTTFARGLGNGERVWADPERVGQVLRNLLNNAAKYSSDGAPIELRAIPENGRVRVEVADHGPGIQAEDLTRIFEKFGRGRDQEGKKVPGVGLGLYLSRRIIQGHDSELRVETKPGEGSVFGFDLKVAR